LFKHLCYENAVIRQQRTEEQHTNQNQCQNQAIANLMQLFATIETGRHVLPAKNGFAISAKRSTHQPECRTGIFLGCCRRKHDVAFLSQHRKAASFVWTV